MITIKRTPAGYPRLGRASVRRTETRPEGWIITDREELVLGPITLVWGLRTRLEIASERFRDGSANDREGVL